MVVTTRLGELRRRKLRREEKRKEWCERKQRDLLAREQLLAQLLAAEVAAGRPGRVFREPRDDRSVYRFVFGPEDSTLPRRHPRGWWWRNHKSWAHWHPNRCLCARTRFWRAWQCYAFACVVCNFKNSGWGIHSLKWELGVNNVDSLRCGGCGAGAF